jgi:hypothetical protein
MTVGGVADKIIQRKQAVRTAIRAGASMGDPAYQRPWD